MEEINNIGPSEKDKLDNAVVLTKRVRKILGIKLPQFKREYSKVRRNEKCPCGSGIKFKYCCKEESIAFNKQEKLAA